MLTWSRLDRRGVLMSAAFAALVESVRQRLLRQVRLVDGDGVGVGGWVLGLVGTDAGVMAGWNRAVLEEGCGLRKGCH
jgi:hypothetical protein